MNTFRPFQNQRSGGPVALNPGYPSSEKREEVKKIANGNIRIAIRGMQALNDDYLYHQYFLRDMAYTCIEKGDIEGAKEWLAKIGEDK